MFVILLALAAHAQTPEEAQLTETMRGLAPLVEAEAGRRFDHLPTLRVGDHRTVLSSLRTSQQVFARIAGTAVSEERERALVELVDQAMAIYAPGQDTVWVLGDKLEAVGTILSMDATGRAAALHCSIAHELTHALQHRYTRFAPREPATEGAWLGIVEGQATLVARRVCRRTEEPSGWRAFELTSGLDNLLSPGDSPLDLRYKVGPVYVARLEADGGKEAVWSAIAAPTPSEASLRAAVAGELGRAWAEGRYSRGLLEARFGSPVDGSYLEAPTLDLQGLVTAGGQGLGYADLPAAFGGEVASWAVPGAAVLTVRLALDGPTSAAAWLQRRAELLTGGVIGLQSPTGQLAPIFVTPVRREGAEGVPGAQLWLSGKAKARFDEVWAVRDGILAGVSAAASRGRDAMKPGELGALLDELLVAPSPGVAGLHALLAGSPPPASPTDKALSTTYALIPAVLALHEGDPTGCATRVEAYADRSALEPEMLILGWDCALEGRAVDLATRLMERVPAAERPLEMLFAHVQLYGEAGRPREGLALLDTIPIATEADRREVADRRIWLCTELKDWRALAGAAKDPAATPELRLDAGYRLYKLGRYHEAMTVIGPLCGMTADPDGCRWLRGALGR